MFMATLMAHVLAGVVLLAGISKAIRPSATQAVLSQTRLPSAPWLVRALAMGEAGLALGVMAFGGRWAFMVLAAVYTGFVIIVFRQRRAGAGCGCFGPSTATVGPLHVIVDGLGVLVAGIAALGNAPGLLEVLPVDQVMAAFTMTLVAVAIVLVRLVLTGLAELTTARALMVGGSE